MDTRFSPDQRRAIVRSLARDEGARPRCPRCDRPMTRRDVPPRDEVSYVRDRIWLICGGCDGSTVVDRREVERARAGDEDPPEAE